MKYKKGLMKSAGGVELTSCYNSKEADSERCLHLQGKVSDGEISYT
jgi:hypothetical protein